MIYHFLKIIVGFGIRLYYREIRIENKKALEYDGPKIIIANHPNTLMDAWMVGHICRHRIFYMAKATFFNTPLKRWLLRGLGLIPINRASESKIQGVSNVDSFENCYQLLENGNTLVIFPEGTSFSERQLRKLKSGTARIALESERRNGGKLGLKVIPVGIVYTRPEKFRSSVLVNVGEGIEVGDYVHDFEQDSLKTARRVTDRFTASLQELLVGSTTVEYEALAEDISEILSSDYIKSDEKGVEKDVNRFKRIFSRLNEMQLESPTTLLEVSDIVYRIKRQLEKLDIKSDFLDRNYRPGMFMRQLISSFVFLIVGLPFALIGLIHNFIPYYTTDLLLPRIVKDQEYFAPLAVLSGLILYPLTYFGFIYLAGYYVELTFWMKVAYFSAMPLMGMFTLFYYKYTSHISVKTNFIFLMKTESDTIATLKKDREELRRVIFGQ